MISKLYITFFFLVYGFVFSQNQPKVVIKDTIKTSKTTEEVLTEIKEVNAPNKTIKYNPTLAGLYSAVLPGLGQYYNKKYWKIPIVWGAIGTGVGIVLWNQNQYTRYRSAYIAELNGQKHEFSGISGVDKNVLGNTQDRAKRQRDYAIGITALIYILNIMDAVVDAHLYEQRHDPELKITPTVMVDYSGQKYAKAGINLIFKF